MGVNVHAVHAVHRDQRGLDELLVHLVREVLLQAAAIQVELAGAGHEADANNGFLAAADGLDGLVDDDGPARSGRDDSVRGFLDHDLGDLLVTVVGVRSVFCGGLLFDIGH
ncbi:Uncharacterised protein [Mycobacteroides abscessus subsp. abscessus]|nr:Uncharacterised protein [Mycobacteroides abscessus subsp. abscessus]